MKRKTAEDKQSRSKKNKPKENSEQDKSADEKNGSSDESESGLDDVTEFHEDEEDEYTWEKKPMIGVQLPAGDGTNKRDSALYKPPTTQELNNLRETETLFHSNLFRLQAEEVVTEIKVAKRASFANWIQELTNFLLSVSPGEQISINDRDWFKSVGVQIPFHCPHPNKGKFRFVKPASVSVIGSFPLQLLLKQNRVVDIAVEMPKEVFKNEDCVNYKYHLKRAMYLACLAHKLSECKLVRELKFSFAHNDRMKPILLITPDKSVSKNLSVAILLHPPENIFHLQRLRPMTCNIEPAWFFQDPSMDKDIATPRYNSAILFDMHMKANVQFITDSLPESKGVRDGILLLKLWAHQRHLFGDIGGFSPFILTMYVVYLLKAKKLKDLMSCYQIARTTWLCLANSDWTKTGITLASQMLLRQPTVENFHDAFDVVFVDPSGYLNLCANMSKTTFFRVQHEAKLTMQFLDDTTLDTFDSLFLNGLPFELKFDHLVVINSCEALQMAAQTLNLRAELLDTNNNLALAVTPKLVDLLESGLSKRIHLLDVQQISASAWDVNSSAPTASKISVGLLLNPEYSSSLLDKGPSPDTKEAEQFIKFWGQRSEIRRFQDGSICETVVWPGSTLADKRIVCKHIVLHVLSSHLGVSPDDIHYLGDTVDPLISIKLDSAADNVFSTGEEQAIAVLKVYDDLRKKLRKIKGLVLNITTVQGISPAFRHAQVFPQPPFKSRSNSNEFKDSHSVLLCEDKCPPWIDPLQVILQLETSGKWPDDYEAICRLKGAFHIQLASNLRDQFGLKASAFPGYVLLMIGGYVFKLIVASYKEVNCLKTVTLRNGSTKMVETDATRALELRIKKLPKVTSALHGLQMQKSTFSATCRLAKRWISSQLMADHVSEIGIELMVAYVYLHPAPFTEPRSPQVGFLRFLRLICSFDWKSTPLIVNFNEELKKDDYSKIQSNFTAARHDLPAMFIAAPYDKLTSLWTRDQPNPVILHRLIVLAHEAQKVFETQLSDPNPSFCYKAMFRPCLDPYDVIIHLNPSQIPTDGLHVNIKKRRWVKFESYGKDADLMPVVNYNPIACYLKDLRDSFDDFALFFYDQYGGNYIAVLWKPRAFESQSFKVSQAANQLVTHTNQTGIMMSVNLMAVVEDFSNLGTGLVKRVEARTDKWTR